MQVSIKTYGDTTKTFNGMLDLSEKSTVQDALDIIGIENNNELNLFTFVVLLNQKNASLQDKLKNGDKILILQSMAGG